MNNRHLCGITPVVIFANAFVSILPNHDFYFARGAHSSTSAIVKTETAANGPAPAPVPANPRVVSKILLGCLLPGVSLDVIELRQSQMRPVACGIRVSHSSGSFILHSLNQLKGLVNITTERQALAFVRLRTSRRFTYEWGGTSNVIEEIVSCDQIADKRYVSTEVEGVDDYSGLRSGFQSVLSTRAYKIFPNEPVMYNKTANGFTITRWVCLLHSPHVGSPPRVEKWREDVLTDGSYKLTVLKSGKPPRLPKTQWFVYLPK